MTQKNLTTTIDRNETAIAAADVLIANYLDGNDLYWRDEEALIAQASTALANKFCFALIEDGQGSFYFNLSSTDYWKKNQECDSNGPPYVGLLVPPSIMEMEENSYAGDPDTSFRDQVNEIMKAGFVWDKDFQSFMEEFNPITDRALLDVLTELKGGNPPAAAVPAAPRPCGP